jgi:hypothetical protein
MPIAARGDANPSLPRAGVISPRLNHGSPHGQPTLSPTDRRCDPIPSPRLGEAPFREMRMGPHLRSSPLRGALYRLWRDLPFRGDWPARFSTLRTFLGRCAWGHTFGPHPFLALFAPENRRCGPNPECPLRSHLRSSPLRGALYRLWRDLPFRGDWPARFSTLRPFLGRCAWGHTFGPHPFLALFAPRLRRQPSPPKIEGVAPILGVAILGVARVGAVPDFQASLTRIEIDGARCRAPPPSHQTRTGFSGTMASPFWQSNAF